MARVSRSGTLLLRPPTRPVRSGPSCLDPTTSLAPRPRRSRRARRWTTLIADGRPPLLPAPRSSTSPSLPGRAGLPRTPAAGGRVGRSSPREPSQHPRAGNTLSSIVVPTASTCVTPPRVDRNREHISAPITLASGRARFGRHPARKLHTHRVRSEGAVGRRSGVGACSPIASERTGQGHIGLAPAAPLPVPRLLVVPVVRVSNPCVGGSPAAAGVARESRHGHRLATCTLIGMSERFARAPFAACGCIRLGWLGSSVGLVRLPGRGGGGRGRGLLSGRRVR